MKMKKIVMAAVAASLGLGITSAAFAGAYAISYQNNTDLFLSFDPAANTTLLSAVPLSTADANLNGFDDSQGGIGFTDSPVANAPTGSPLRVENAFNQIGVQGTEYSNADAWIPFEQTAGDNFTQVLSIAEGNLNKNGSTADADSQNSSATALSINFNVSNDDTVITLTFGADPYMEVLLHPEALIGSLAFAEITTVATITDNTIGSDTFGQVIFEWTPDGTDGGINGGTEVLDPESLNVNIQTGIPNTAAVYDPTGDASVGNLTPTLLRYEAFTDLLGIGSYTLNLAAESDIGLLALKEVPEPGILALLGIGFLGAGVARRRLQKA